MSGRFSQSGVQRAGAKLPQSRRCAPDPGEPQEHPPSSLEKQKQRREKAMHRQQAAPRSGQAPRPPRRPQNRPLPREDDHELATVKDNKTFLKCTEEEETHGVAALTRGLHHTFEPDIRRDVCCLGSKCFPSTPILQTWFSILCETCETYDERCLGCSRWRGHASVRHGAVKGSIDSIKRPRLADKTRTWTSCPTSNTS